MKKIINGNKEWKKYWDTNGNFRMFDLATKKNGNLFIHGRVDDVINIRGHRIGSEEIESITLKIKEIFECCAISINDDIEGHVIHLFTGTDILFEIIETISSILIFGIMCNFFFNIC